MGNIVSYVGKKNGKIKIVSNFSVIKLCFFINVLIDKTYFPPAPPPPQSCGTSPDFRNGLAYGFMSDDIPRDFAG